MKNTSLFQFFLVFVVSFSLLSGFSHAAEISWHAYELGMGGENPVTPDHSSPGGICSTVMWGANSIDLLCSRSLGGVIASNESGVIRYTCNVTQGEECENDSQEEVYRQGSCPGGGKYEHGIGCAPADSEDGTGPQNAGDQCPAEGNPINVLNGNKFQTFRDISSKGQSPLTFSRTYNSHFDRSIAVTQALGKHWRHNYDRRVLSYDNKAFVIRGDGQVLFFNYDGNDWVGPPKYQLSYLYENSNVSGFQLKIGNTLETYNVLGQMLTLTNLKRNDSISFNYDTHYKQLATATDQFGNQLIYQYDEKSLVQVTSSFGESISISYANAYLESVSYSDQSTESYQYLSGTGKLIGLTDRKGNLYAQWGYDEQTGLAIYSQHLDGSGNVVDRYDFDFTHVDDAGDPRVSVTNPLGKMTTYHYQVYAGIRKVVQIEGHPSTNCAGANKAYTYYSNGLIESKTDWKGVVTRFEYDTLGRETLRVEAEGSPEEQSTTTEWHAEFRSPTKVTEGNRVTEYSYDTNGRVLTKRIGEAISSSDDQVWSWTYNTEGKLSTADGPRSDVNDLTQYSYDANNYLESVSNALGQSTSFTQYNSDGRPTLITDANGTSQQLAYNNAGKLISVTLLHPTDSTLNQITSYEYDVLGQLTKIISSDGSYTSYQYDGARRLKAVSNNLGDRIEYVLDAAGNTTNESILDSSGSLHYSLTKSYDELSRLMELQTSPDATASFSYDVNNNLTSSENGRSLDNSAEYDALDRIKKTIDPLLNETQFAYDDLGRITSVTDARSLTTHYQYDVYGNQVLLDSPDTGITTYVHDTAGNRTSMLDNNGVIADYSYDALNRLLSVSYPDNPTENISYSYDDVSNGNEGKGKLTGIIDSSGEINFRYDYAGRLIEKNYLIQGQSYTRSYSYNSEGQLESLSYPGGRELRYVYDEVARITAIYTRENSTAAEQLVLSSVRYLPFGPIESFVYGNGVLQDFTYDSHYRQTQIQSFGSSTILERNYEYDGNGNITSITTEGGSSDDRTLEYDELDRIEAVTDFTNSFFYTYDAVGNRLTRNLNQSGAQTSESYSYAGDSNRLNSVEVTSPQGNSTRSFTYDNNGNTTADSITGAVTGLITSQYAESNRPTSADANGVNIQYLHNSLGQRTEKSTASKTEHFHYDESGQLIAVTDSNGTVSQEIIFLGSMPVAVLSDDGSDTVLPIVTIEFPSPDVELEPATNYTFIASAADEEDGDISNSVQWTSTIDGSLGSGSNINISALSLGEHFLTVSAQNSAGISASSVIRFMVKDPNEAPVLTLLTPTVSEISNAVSIEFTATAYDDEDGYLGSEITWSSSTDGVLGSGSLVTAQLSLGEHIVLASVSDSDGYQVSDSINLTVREVLSGDDFDADGLEDTIEIQNFGNLDQTPEGDFDGDGVSNISELTYGTDPLIDDFSNRLSSNTAHSQITVSNNARTVSSDFTTGWLSAFAIGPLPAGGKYYWEVTSDSNYTMMGLGGDDVQLDSYTGKTDSSYGWHQSNFDNNPRFYHQGNQVPYTVNYGPGDRISIAYDSVEGKVWFAKNGVWNGDPVAGTGAQFESLTGLKFPIVSLYHGTSTAYFSPADFQNPIPEGYQPSRFSDRDSDGMDDLWEFTQFNSLAQQASGDVDNDGITNIQEYLTGRNPTQEDETDTDADGLDDLWELQNFGDLGQTAEADFDGDGASNYSEFTYETDPLIDDFSNRLSSNTAHPQITVSNNARTVSSNFTTGWLSAFAIGPLPAGGKYYWEVTSDSNYTMMGLGGDDVQLDSYTGKTDSSYGWHQSNYDNNPRFYHQGSQVPYTVNYGPGDRISIAYDSVEGKVWFGKNGVWNGDPVAGTGAQFESLAGLKFPIVSLYHGTSTAYFSPADFQYPMPAGYQPSKFSDRDADGMDDYWEYTHFESLDQTPESDFDGDGYSNLNEYLLGSNPMEQDSQDVDVDGMIDEVELQYFGNLDQTGEGDFDGDGVSNLFEVNYGTDPLVDDFSNYFTTNTAHANISISNQGKTVSSTSNAWRTAIASGPMPAGAKYYWEVTSDSDYTLIGLGGAEMDLDLSIGKAASGYGWATSDYDNNPRFYHNSVLVPYTINYGDGDRIMLAYDAVEGKLWFGKNGVWNGDPAAGTGAQFEGLTGLKYPANSVYSGQATSYFSPGEFQYSIPEGYQPSRFSDRDQDGLDDYWEFTHFESLDQEAENDFDGDGLTNLEEYQQNSDPKRDLSNHLDPTMSDQGYVTFSNDNKTFYSSNSGYYRSAYAENSFASGAKYYWEAEVVKEAGNSLVGIGNDIPVNVVDQPGVHHYCGSTNNSYGWISNGEAKTYNNGTSQLFPLSFSTGDRVMLAFDPDAGKLWFGVNGVWEGDPAAGTGERYSNISGPQYATVSSYLEAVTLIFNPTQFDHSPPQGFVASEVQQ